MLLHGSMHSAIGICYCIGAPTLLTNSVSSVKLAAPTNICYEGFTAWRTAASSASQAVYARRTIEEAQVAAAVWDLKRQSHCHREDC
jgi:hypothetical protein